MNKIISKIIPISLLLSTNTFSEEYIFSIQMKDINYRLQLCDINTYNGCNFGISNGYTSSLMDKNATWVCMNGELIENCSKNKEIINSVCGSSNGQTLINQPSTNLCHTGTASVVVNGENEYTWSCIGSKNTETTLLGENVNCQATKNIQEPISLEVYLDIDAINSEIFNIVDEYTVKYAYKFNKNITIQNFTIEDLAVGAIYEDLQIINQNCNYNNNEYDCEIVIKATENSVCVSGIVECINNAGTYNKITFYGF